MSMIESASNLARVNISVNISDLDKLLLMEITRQDELETGTVGNQSATIRRLIRQEAKRRNINLETLTAEVA